VDPELVPFLDLLPALEPGAATLGAIRAEQAAWLARPADARPEFATITVTERRVPGPPEAPDVRVLVYLPQHAAPATPVPALLWIHGGGYVIGSADLDDVPVKRMVAALGCVAISVDYRLAPETPFPGPVEDCYAALHWLYTHAAELGVDARRIAVGGVSAGGGLSAALALLARDRGVVPLAFELLICPMLDDRTVVAAEPHPYNGEFGWTPEANYFGWASLLGPSQKPGSAGVSPYAAAARATDLAGLPPTYISVGGLDLFVDEDLDYARRLIRAGVPTEVHIYPGAYHGFSLAAEAQVTQAAERTKLVALRRALHPPVPTSGT
jgi:acetyl esterase/lipase